MLSRSKIKLIRSLEQQKYRQKHGLFVAQGDKTVTEIIASGLDVECVLAKKTWLEQISGELRARIPEINEVDDKELSQISFQKTPNQAIALVRIPHYKLDAAALTDGLSLYLDSVQDPGNLGTIIRLADWFGIDHVLCGEGCADPFAHKTVQSTMGAITRVKTYKCDESFFKKFKTHYPDFPVYGTFLSGKILYNTPLSDKAVIVMGNESKGISNSVAKYVDQRLMIPQFPAGKTTSDSLNVAAATAIVCAEFRKGI